MLLNALAVFVVCLACSSIAQAQATRTWVSGVGDDVNPCSRTAPCKTFAGAISKTAAGGEISVLDPGGFGALTITKSITVNGKAQLAGITASLVNGIIVNAGANDKVILKNLEINGVGNGLDGIRFLGGGQLTVENCTISGFTGEGIEVNKTANGNLYLKDTNITRVTTGVSLTTNAGFVVANFDNVRIEGNSNGILAVANSFATVRNSSIFQNTTNGIAATGVSVINVESTVVAHNGTGINASVSGAVIRLSNVSVFNNGTGINAAGGSTVLGFFNNRIAGNGTNGAPTAQQAQQ
jgi:hypothetical protein